MGNEIPFISNANGVKALDMKDLNDSKHDVNGSRERCGTDNEVRERFCDPERSSTSSSFFLSTLPLGSIPIIADQVEVEPTVGGTRSRSNLLVVTGTARPESASGREVLSALV